MSSSKNPDSAAADILFRCYFHDYVKAILNGAESDSVQMTLSDTSDIMNFIYLHSITEIHHCISVCFIVPL